MKHFQFLLEDIRGWVRQRLLGSYEDELEARLLESIALAVKKQVEPLVLAQQRTAVEIASLQAIVAVLRRQQPPPAVEQPLKHLDG